LGFSTICFSPLVSIRFMISWNLVFFQSGSIVIWLVILIVGGVLIKGIYLSPLLFYLPEEVSNRGIFQLASSHKILPMIGSKGTNFPTHILYVDDIFVFCKATRKSLTNLIKFLHVYGIISDQLMNSSKYLFFTIDNLSPLIIIFTLFLVVKETLFLLIMWFSLSIFVLLRYGFSTYSW